MSDSLRERQLEAISRLIVRHLDKHPMEVAEHILEELEMIEIEDFELNHIKALETQYSELHGEMPF